MKLHDCWKQAGIWGDKSCPQLAEAVHCRNCPIYSSAAAQLLDREIDDNYLAQSALEIRSVRQTAIRDTSSAVVFRIGAELLALPSDLVHEVGVVRPIHSLPHRRSGTVLGIANVRGALLICISLHVLLGIDKAPTTSSAPRTLVHQRLLVAGQEGERIVLPVDEVLGVHRYHPEQLGEAPATVSKSTTTYTRGTLPWRDKTVGLLDAQLLFYSINKSLT